MRLGNVYLGSKSPHKIRAVEFAVMQLQRERVIEFERALPCDGVASYPVESGVPAQPNGLVETLQGATGRLHQLLLSMGRGAGAPPEQELEAGEERLLEGNAIALVIESGIHHLCGPHKVSTCDERTCVVMDIAVLRDGLFPPPLVTTSAGIPMPTRFVARWEDEKTFRGRDSTVGQLLQQTCGAECDATDVTKWLSHDRVRRVDVLAEATQTILKLMVARRDIRVRRRHA